MNSTSAMKPGSGARWVALAVVVLLVLCSPTLRGQTQPAKTGQSYFIDCSAAAAGDGSRQHPWNTLEAAQAHSFVAGDRVALARGTTCHGAFAPQGSGAEGNSIRLTAYGKGPMPRIVASASDRQGLLLFNQEYWQIDSLDFSGANKYGVFVSGDSKALHHPYLKNLYVHDVVGGAMKNKDNGLVVVGPSSAKASFNDVLVDGVDAAHTNQWSGILVGGGNFAYTPDAPLNRNIEVRNSTVHDVYGDGIILFRDQDSSIRTSAAWQTGMQPTETTGTPNAIWTWTCTDCVVADNEAYLTDSPGVDGGAYDIDWDNTRNTVDRNYAHDTQGYCVAVFAAGYTTSESAVRNNLCIANGLSPRLSALQGAVYLHTWNDGPIKNLILSGNTIQWNPPVSDAAAIVNDALVKGAPIAFVNNRVVSSASRIYRSNADFAPSQNAYSAQGEALFTLGDRKDVTLAELQKAGREEGSTIARPSPEPPAARPLRIEAYLDLKLDEDGLLSPEVRAQLVVLRDLAGEYGPERLPVEVHLRTHGDPDAEANALQDLNDVYPGALRFDFADSSTNTAILIRLENANGSPLKAWQGLQNAATLGGMVRDLLGAPQYAHMQAKAALKAMPLTEVQP